MLNGYISPMTTNNMIIVTDSPTARPTTLRSEPPDDS